MTDNGDSERLVDRDAQAGDGRDRALRPLSFSDFVGQKAAIANLRVFVEAAAAVRRRWTMSSCPARRASARRRSPRSWRGKWAWDFGQPPVR